MKSSKKRPALPKAAKAKPAKLSPAEKARVVSKANRMLSGG